MKQTLKIFFSFLVFGSSVAIAQVKDCTPEAIEEISTRALDRILTQHGPQKAQTAINALITVRDLCKDESGQQNQYVCIGQQTRNNYLMNSTCGAEPDFIQIDPGIQVGLLSTEVFPVFCHGANFKLIKILILSGPHQGRDGYMHAPKKNNLGNVNYLEFGPCFGI